MSSVAHDAARPQASAAPVASAALLLLTSGCAALVYQVIWFQLLPLVLGASTVSLGVLLATFMGGLCLGSMLAPRLLDGRSPLRVLAALEVLTGAYALGLLVALPGLGALYESWPSAGGLLWRAVTAALCLLPPTVAMGATLPAVARFLEPEVPGRAPAIGICYAANVFGGVGGALLAGFVLLRVFDVTVATLCAAGLNGAVAVAALRLVGMTPVRNVDASRAELRAHERRSEATAWPIYAVTALSGMTALAAEVIWTRQLSLLLGATVYAYAVILAVFLLGIGLGSAAGTRLARVRDPRMALAVCQLALCVAFAYAGLALSRWLPFWPIDVTQAEAADIRPYVDAVRAALAVLPAALLWGMSFTLALAALAGRASDAARLAARVYAVNTIGAIVGALAATFLLVVSLGSHGAQRFLVLACAAAAACAAVPVARPGARGLRAAGIAVLAVVAAALVPPLPPVVAAYGRFTPTRGVGANVLHAAEGLTASVAVSEDAEGIRTFHSAGKPQASTYPADMRLQRMLGHLATLAADQPASVLVIGLGAGVTAGATAVDPSVEEVVVAEIEPLVPALAHEYFAEHNFGVVRDEKVTIHVDDGRHYLATAGRRFDAITCDPLDPWVRGAAALYTEEFWRLVRSRLNPGGVVTAFVQLYESSEAATKSEIATFLEVFPHGMVFANTLNGAGYDLVLLARAEGAPIDVDRMHARLQRPSYRAVADSLRSVGFRSATDLLGTYVGGKADLDEWLRGAELNRDRNLRLQYLAGDHLNTYEAASIFAAMTARPPRFPREQLVGAPARLEELRQKMRAIPAVE